MREIQDSDTRMLPVPAVPPPSAAPRPVARRRTSVELLSRKARPETPAELQRACARWITILFAMTVLLQRFAVPNQPVALLLPLMILWCAQGLIRGLLELDRTRATLWMLAVGVTGIAVPLQYIFVDDPSVSATSWGLLLVTWIPFVFRLTDRRRETYMMAMRGISKVGLWLGSGLIFFMAVQFVGLTYEDYVADIFPKAVLLQDFVITYEISYGSSLMKGNAWIGLEPSTVSFQMGVAIIAALLVREKLPKMLVLLLGLLCTTAGSGFTVAGVGVLVILFSRMRWSLFRYALLIPAGVIVLFGTSFGQSLLERFTSGTDDASTSLRAITPYTVVWPEYIKSPIGMIFGYGPGSSQDIAEVYNRTVSLYGALLIPAPIKLFYDYGLLAGAVLAWFFVIVYTGGPSRAMSLALGLNLWTIQPGTTTMVFVSAIQIIVTWWAPKTFRQVEDDLVPSPNASIEPPPVPWGRSFPPIPRNGPRDAAPAAAGAPPDH